MVLECRGRLFHGSGGKCATTTLRRAGLRLRIRSADHWSKTHGARPPPRVALPAWASDFARSL